MSFADLYGLGIYPRAPGRQGPHKPYSLTLELYVGLGKGVGAVCAEV